MPDAWQSKFDDVDQLLLNAQLRDALEPFLDESVSMLNVDGLPTATENEFLASMLAWERAPALPISQWFSPELTLPAPEGLTDARLREVLSHTIHLLYEQRIILEFTEHLSDRELYLVICRDILPSHEKKVDLPKNFLHWHCLDADTEWETWLAYYATDMEREEWAEEHDAELPPALRLPHPRKMPRRPQA